MASHSVEGGGGLRLHVEATGNPYGKPILFIHGFSNCRLQWRKQLYSADLGRDFHLVAMDLRGHGLSDKPRDVYGDSKLWADDVHAVITTLGLDHPVLTVSSYGGAVLSDYLHFYGEERIAGTNWVGAVSRLGDPLQKAGFVGTECLAALPGSFSENIDESVDALQKVIRLNTYADPSPEDLYFFLGFHVIVPPHVRVGLLSRHLDHDGVVAQLRKPMLVSHGEQDAVMLLSMSSHLAGLVKHARLSTYPQVGHMPFWEAPERFNRELREFREAV